MRDSYPRAINLSIYPLPILKIFKALFLVHNCGSQNVKHLKNRKENHRGFHENCWFFKGFGTMPAGCFDCDFFKEPEPGVLWVWDIQRTRTGGSLKFKEPHRTLVATRACCENHNLCSRTGKVFERKAFSECPRSSEGRQGEDRGYQEIAVRRGPKSNPLEQPSVGRHHHHHHGNSLCALESGFLL